MHRLTEGLAGPPVGAECETPAKIIATHGEPLTRPSTESVDVGVGEPQVIS